MSIWLDMMASCCTVSVHVPTPGSCNSMHITACRRPSARGVSSLASTATSMESKGREGEVHVGTWEWPMAWHSTSASRVPARPPERELMNTSSGLSGSAEPRNCLVPRRYSCGILCDGRMNPIHKPYAGITLQHPARHTCSSADGCGQQVNAVDDVAVRTLTCTAP